MKYGSHWSCLHYRILNTVTVRDLYQLFRMVACIDTRGEDQIFLTIDVNSGYWQVGIDP